MPSDGTEVKSYLTNCEEDEEGNLILNFPDELLEAMGWSEGTELEISIIGERLVLRKVNPGDV